MFMIHRRSTKLDVYHCDSPGHTSYTCDRQISTRKWRSQGTNFQTRHELFQSTHDERIHYARDHLRKTNDIEYIFSHNISPKKKNGTVLGADQKENTSPLKLNGRGTLGPPGTLQIVCNW